MIQEITVTNANEDSLTLELSRPDKTGFVVVDVSGLGPAKSSINMSGNSGMSGGVFNSAITGTKNIVLTLLFLASPTIEEARLRSYKFFQNESRVRLDIVTDKSAQTDPATGELYGPFYIHGFVESNEPSIFSKSQGCVVSIICPDPYFRTYAGVFSGEIESVSKLFSFPFSNEGNTKTINFGERLLQSVDFKILYEGSVNVEPTLTITAVGGAVKDPRIFFYNENDPDVVEYLRFQFTESLPELQDGDRLEIVCEKQNKSVIRYSHDHPEGINYIGAVTVDSAWPVLIPGDNLFSYTAADGTGGYIRFGYEYTSKYIAI